MKRKKLLVCVLILAIVLSTALLYACNKEPENKTPEIATADKISNAPANSLNIEWVGGYSASKPTMVYVHGEMRNLYNTQVNLQLTEENYRLEAVADGDGTTIPANVSANAATVIKTKGRNLADYWSAQGYNVGIFHYEAFADDDNLTLAKKIFSPVAMRYVKASGDGSAFENNSIPNYSLAEILAARLVADTAASTGKELRLVGNGLGAVLALAASDYLYQHYEYGNVGNNVLPVRLAVIDPYLSTESIPTNYLWRGMDESNGLLSMAEDMTAITSGKGLIIEMVESINVTTEKELGTDGSVIKDDKGNDKTKEVYTPAYSISYNDAQAASKNRLIENTAYLKMLQRYSSAYNSSYKDQKRAGADWYLYSVNGSDAAANGAAMGFYTNATTNNYGENRTRPMLNDKSITNGSYKSSAGYNYSVSAWTPTAWTRAQRGVRYETQTRGADKKDANGTTIKEFGLAVGTYTAYEMKLFEAENSQVAQNLNNTIVCGYVFNDKNKNNFKDDGAFSGMSDFIVNGILTYTKSTDSPTTVLEVSTKTDADGFFVFRLDTDKNGKAIDYSAEHSFVITVVPRSVNVSFIATPGTTYHTRQVGMHSFEQNTKTISITQYYGKEITLCNCGVLVGE